MDKTLVPIAETVPDFMKKDIEVNGPRRLAERMREDPDFYIHAAMYAANDISTSERLLLLTEALKLSEISKLGEWQFEMAIYPETAMARKDFNRTSNPEMPLRAFYLLEALQKLLALIGAPEAMASDLRLFMQRNLPYVAKKRAKVQKTMIEHPEWSNTKIAEECGYDLTRMGYEVDHGQLIRCPLVADSAEQS